MGDKNINVFVGMFGNHECKGADKDVQCRKAKIIFHDLAHRLIIG